jgi:hypothetical protein
MKRSAMPPRTKPMNRGTKPMKRGLTGLLRVASTQRSAKRMKSSRPKSTPIRRSAKGKDCTLRFPGVCNYRMDTTVLCHRNGAGMGMKAADTSAAYGCFECHRVLDGQAPRPAGFSRELMLSLLDLAIAETNRILKREGLM